MKTNFEKLKELTPSEFWGRITELQKHPLAQYIDYPAWLNATDTDIKHFIKRYADCVVRANADSRYNDVEIHGVALEPPKYNAAMHEAYVTVADYANARLLRVPACQVEFLNKTE